MVVIHDAWCKEEDGIYHPWEIEIGQEVTFRKKDAPRVICITEANEDQIEVKTSEKFGEDAPADIRGQPVVKFHDLQFGLMGHGFENLRIWLGREGATFFSKVASQKLGGSTVYRIFPIDKEKILSLDTGDIAHLIEMAMAELKLGGVIQPWNLTVSGYDYDPRDLAEIPEVKAWFVKIQAEFPYLPIFLSVFSLIQYLLGQLDITVVCERKKKITLSEQEEIDATVGLHEKMVPGGGEKMREQLEHTSGYAVNPEQVESLCAEIKWSATMFLATQKIDKAIAAKAIDEAFVRIKQCLGH
jgi:hypothetical protein